MKNCPFAVTGWLLVGLWCDIRVKNVQNTLFGTDKGQSRKTSRSHISVFPLQGPLYPFFFCSLVKDFFLENTSIRYVLFATFLSIIFKCLSLLNVYCALLHHLQSATKQCMCGWESNWIQCQLICCLTLKGNLNRCKTLKWPPNMWDNEELMGNLRDNTISGFISQHGNFWNS